MFTNTVELRFTSYYFQLAATRGSWKLGRICELIQSADGQIRVAKVRIGNGKIFKRPLNMLYPIEVTNDKIQSSETNTISKDMTIKNTENKGEEITISRPMCQAAINARKHIKHMMDL